MDKPFHTPSKQISELPGDPAHGSRHKRRYSRNALQYPDRLLYIAISVGLIRVRG